MAVELDLNRFSTKPPANETPFQLLERRNRERTYLVLFVHDRSLSMQTGRHWMLPEVVNMILSNPSAFHLFTPRTTLSGMQTLGMSGAVLQYDPKTSLSPHSYNYGELQ